MILSKVIAHYVITMFRFSPNVCCTVQVSSRKSFRKICWIPSILWMLPWWLIKLFDIKLLLWEFPLYNCFYGNSRHVRSFVAIKVILATNIQYVNMDILCKFRNNIFMTKLFDIKRFLWKFPLLPWKQASGLRLFRLQLTHLCAKFEQNRTIIGNLKSDNNWQFWKIYLHLNLPNLLSQTWQCLMYNVLTNSPLYHFVGQNLKVTWSKIMIHEPNLKETQFEIKPFTILFWLLCSTRIPHHAQKTRRGMTHPWT